MSEAKCQTSGLTAYPHPRDGDKSLSKVFASLPDALGGHMQAEECQKLIKLGRVQLIQPGAQGVCILQRLGIRKSRFHLHTHVSAKKLRRISSLLPESHIIWDKRAQIQSDGSCQYLFIFCNNWPYKNFSPPAG